MSAYIIGYDLDKPGQNYPAIENAIIDISNKNYWHCLDSTWIIISNLNASAIVTNLNSHLDSNDKLFVSELTRDAAWVGSFSQKCRDWLKTNL